MFAMKRQRSVFPAVGFFLISAPLMFSQDRQSPELPPEVLGPQLIAWSEMQNPRPVPLPPPDRPDQQQPQDKEKKADPANPSAGDSGKSSQQTFTGTIVKDSGTYVLKVTGNTVYQIENQDSAQQYEGKPVRVTGTLNADGHTLRIVKIELVS
jgi:hypothetical protein